MPLTDIRRDNDMDSERSKGDWRNYRIKYKKTPAAAVFRDGLPQNAVEAMDSVMPDIGVEYEKPKEGEVGIPPIDVLIGTHGHANPITKTAVVDWRNAPEEVMHLVDQLQSGSGLPFSRFTDRKDYRDAVQKGTQRMSEAYTKPRFGTNRGMFMSHTIPDNQRMAQLLREDPDSPHYTLGKEFLSSHGKGYELGNQITDFPRFERRAAAMKESLPAIIELPRDTAQKYYPEALEMIDKWLDSIPPREKARTAK